MFEIKAQIITSHHLYIRLIKLMFLLLLHTLRQKLLQLQFVNKYKCLI